MNAAVASPAAMFTPQVSGRFTIQSPTGAHRTYQLDRWEEFNKGQGAYTVGMLTGPDNRKDYTDFAWLDQARGRVVMYKTVNKKPNPYLDHQKMLEALIFHGRLCPGCTVHMETICRRCRRPLTTPTSVQNMIGPECAGRE